MEVIMGKMVTVSSRIIMVGLTMVALLPGCKESKQRSAVDPAPAVESGSGNSAAVKPGGEAPAAGGKMVPLTLEWPMARFSGTPKNIREPKLEPVADKPPALMVPEGVVNLSSKKPVTSSDANPVIGELATVTDSDKEAIDGSYVELGPGVQWVQIDLGQLSEVYAIVLWHYHMEGRVYHDVVVRVADDPDFITNVRTLFNNDFDNSSGLGIGENLQYIETKWGKVIDGKGVKARYVRLYSNGSSASDQNHYTEVEVYGKPVK
jgi:hypothetical protein